jgi:hypothetical protein
MIAGCLTVANLSCSASGQITDLSSLLPGSNTPITPDTPPLSPAPEVAKTFQMVGNTHSKFSYSRAYSSQQAAENLSTVMGSAEGLISSFLESFVRPGMPLVQSRLSGVQSFALRFNSGPLFGRYGHSMAVVGTKLFVFGGDDSEGTLRNDVWSYETATNTWALAKADDNAGSGVVDVNYPKRRAYHSMEVVGTKLFVFGGGDSEGTLRNDVWSFETTTNTWALAKADDNAGSGVVDLNYPKRRASHSMAVVGTKLFVFGGSDSGLVTRNDVWSFETTTNTWALAKADDNAGSGVVDVNYPKKRIGHSMEVVGTKLFVFGGRNSGLVTRNDVWSFETTTNTWALAKADDNAGSGVVDVNYPKRRYIHSMAVVGTKLFVFGGLDSASAYRNDVWSFETTTSPSTVYAQVLVAVDVTPTSGVLYDKAILNLAASAKGDLASVSTPGIDLYLWNASTGIFVSAASNTATNLTAGLMNTITVPLNYRTSDN